MLKKHFKMLCTMALLSLFLQQSAIASTMYPNAFDNIFEKLDNFFHCSTTFLAYIDGITISLFLIYSQKIF